MPLFAAEIHARSMYKNNERTKVPNTNMYLPGIFVFIKLVFSIIIFEEALPNLRLLYFPEELQC